MKKNLLIIGASGHGKVIADVAKKIGKWETISFLDDNPDITTSLGLDVIGNLENISAYIDEYDMFAGIGNNEIRKKVYKKLKAVEATIPVLIHPTAVIGEDVQIESGTVVMAGAVINCSTRIGKGCIVNTGVTIDHDNIIEDFVHISPGTNLAGTVTVGGCSWLGIGSAISNNVTVANNSTIGAGAIVVRNITKSGVYVGVPAKKISDFG